MYIKNKLASIRKKKGLRLYIAADLIGISHDTLNRIEIGKRPVTFRNLFKISKGYDLPINKFIWFNNKLLDSDIINHISLDNIGYRIREIRYKKGFNCYTLVNLLKIKRSMYSHIENNHRLPSLELLKVLSQIYDNASVAYIITANKQIAFNGPAFDNMIITPYILKEMGKKMVEIRRGKNISFKILAQILDIDVDTYKAIEHGIKSPTASELKKISDFFDMPMSYIMNSDNSLVA